MLIPIVTTERRWHLAAEHPGGGGAASIVLVAAAGPDGRLAELELEVLLDDPAVPVVVKVRPS